MSLTDPHANQNNNAPTVSPNASFPTSGTLNLNNSGPASLSDVLKKYNNAHPSTFNPGASISGNHSSPFANTPAQEQSNLLFNIDRSAGVNPILTSPASFGNQFDKTKLQELVKTINGISV